MRITHPSGHSYIHSLEEMRERLGEREGERVTELIVILIEIDFKLEISKRQNFYLSSPPYSFVIFGVVVDRKKEERKEFLKDYKNTKRDL